MIHRYKYKSYLLYLNYMSSLDYNVDNYTISELLAILGLDDPTVAQIIDKTNNYIAKFTRENQPQMTIFFQKIQI